MPSERTQRRIDRLLDEAERALDEHDWLLARERARDVLLLDDGNEDAHNFLRTADRALSAGDLSPGLSPTRGEETPDGEAEGLPEQTAITGEPATASNTPSAGARLIAPAPEGPAGPQETPAGSAGVSPAPGSAAAFASHPSLPASLPQGERGERVPTFFANGRYVVKRFLGEGGKKEVYVAHDTVLDRDVAFALIKTEGLDQVARERISREAQAMGRLGTHPHVVTVFDLGEEPPLSGLGEGRGQPYMVTELMGGGRRRGRDRASAGPPTAA